MQRAVFPGLFGEGAGFPVTIRLLDPPLHEFLPNRDGLAEQLHDAQADGRHRWVEELEALLRNIDELAEINPMLGHRGVRLGITYPEITEMQVRAICEAASELKKAGKNPMPELMVPVTCDVSELEATRKIFDRVRAEVRKQTGVEVECLYGTMIEIP